MKSLSVLVTDGAKILREEVRTKKIFAFSIKNAV
jgi:hypothetical protein